MDERLQPSRHFVDPHETMAKKGKTVGWKLVRGTRKRRSACFTHRQTAVWISLFHIDCCDSRNLVIRFW